MGFSRPHLTGEGNPFSAENLLLSPVTQRFLMLWMGYRSRDQTLGSWKDLMSSSQLALYHALPIQWALSLLGVLGLFGRTPVSYPLIVKPDHSHICPSPLPHFLSNQTPDLLQPLFPTFLLPAKPLAAPCLCSEVGPHVIPRVPLSLKSDAMSYCKCQALKVCVAFPGKRRK